VNIEASDLFNFSQAKMGIETDTDLIEFALPTVALEEKFAETFKESRGKVDPELKLGFWSGGVRFRRRATLGAARSAKDAGAARGRRASVR
jgi:hypothetical protein